MNDPDELALRMRIRRGGHYVDRQVLKYFREMLAYCRRENNRETRWYYEAGHSFATAIIYGALPARPDYNTAGAPPQTVATQFPAGWTGRAPAKQPLKKIIKRFSRPWRTWELSYETLECGHILTAPVGYSVAAKSRRCPHCAIAALLSKKKPARADAVKAKAVGA